MTTTPIEDDMRKDLAQLWTVYNALFALGDYRLSTEILQRMIKRIELFQKANP
jgi:hypothetical protein